MGGKKFLFFIFGMAVCGVAEAAGFRQEMSVSVGVFDAAKVVLDYAEANGRFEIAAVVKTDNLFGSLYPFSGKYKSSGKKLQNGVKPELYETYTKTRSHTRTKKIFYDKSGVAYKRVSSKDKKENTVMIDDVPETADAADLQTVFAELIQLYAKTGGCALKREVYDGKKHYNVIVRDKGVSKRQFAQKEVLAKRCQVYIENLKENNDNILWDISAEKPINFWVGASEKSQMPYVLEIGIDSTPLGELKVLPTTLETK